jgi:hypothetical protein
LKLIFIIMCSTKSFPCTQFILHFNFRGFNFKWFFLIAFPKFLHFLLFYHFLFFYCFFKFLFFFSVYHILVQPFFIIYLFQLNLLKNILNISIINFSFLHFFFYYFYFFSMISVLRIINCLFFFFFFWNAKANKTTFTAKWATSSYFKFIF